jgi:hypothetical protein
VVRHLTGACGYLYGLSCRGSRCSLWAPLLGLPRLDAGSNLPIAGFAEHLGLAHPTPTVRRGSEEA